MVIEAQEVEASPEAADVGEVSFAHGHDSIIVVGPVIFTDEVGLVRATLQVSCHGGGGTLRCQHRRRS